MVIDVLRHSQAYLTPVGSRHGALNVANRFSIDELTCEVVGESHAIIGTLLLGLGELQDARIRIPIRAKGGLTELLKL